MRIASAAQAWEEADDDTPMGHIRARYRDLMARQLDATIDRLDNGHIRAEHESAADEATLFGPARPQTA
jgi:hypothetical protein